MYTIRINGEYRGRCVDNIIAAKRWVRDHVRYAEGTWIRIPGGIEFVAGSDRAYSFERE